MKVLVLGITGMLGSAVFKELSVQREVYGTIRNSSARSYFTNALQSNIVVGVDVLDQDAFGTCQPVLHQFFKN